MVFRIVLAALPEACSQRLSVCCLWLVSAFGGCIKQGAAPEEATRFTFYETIGKLFPIVAAWEKTSLSTPDSFVLVCNHSSSPQNERLHHQG